MKFAIVFAAICAIAVAAPAGPADDTVLRYDNDNIGVDGYKFAYETSGGITAEEAGTVHDVGLETEHISVRGSFSYLFDGVTYTVNYVADENGFQRKFYEFFDFF